MHLHLEIRRNQSSISACLLAELAAHVGRRFMQALHEDAEADGARILFKSRVLGADVTGGSSLGMRRRAPVCPNAAPHSRGITFCLAQCRPEEGGVCREHDDRRAADAACRLCRKCGGALGTGALIHGLQQSGTLRYLGTCRVLTALWCCSMLQSALRGFRGNSSHQSTWHADAT